MFCQLSDNTETQQVEAAKITFSLELQKQKFSFFRAEAAIQISINMFANKGLVYHCQQLAENVLLIFPFMRNVSSIADWSVEVLEQFKVIIELKSRMDTPWV